MKRIRLDTTRLEGYRRTRTGFAWSLAVLLLSVQLYQVHHLASVSHYVCSEHGQVEHGSDPESVDHAAHAERGSEQVVATKGAGKEIDDLHASCSVGLHLPESHTRLDDFDSLALDPVVRPLDRSSRDGPHESVPLLGLAPKQSPPA